jgi:DNA repair protein RecO (recombination protein O)
MNIQDQGIILSVKKYSENSLIVKIFSQNNGIYSGFIRGALGSKKNNLTYQIANLASFHWSAKLEENLGFFKIELIKSFLAGILSDPIKLNCITSIINIISQNMPERQENSALFTALLNLLKNLNEETSIFLVNYIKLEIDLLENLGYGIDLSKCAVTGLAEELHFVSPKSGKAVSKNAGEKYAAKLLKLPGFLSHNPTNQISKNDLLNGLELSGFFIEKYLYRPNNIRVPDSRQRLINLIKNQDFQLIY